MNVPLAGSSKTAPRILIFSMAMGANYSFALISIETYAPQFIGHNEFFLGSVRLLYRSEFLSAKTDDHIQGVLQN